MVNLSKIKLLIILQVILLSLLSSNLVFAQTTLLQGVEDPCLPGKAACNLCTVFAFISNIITFIMKNILPYLAFLMLVIGGLYMILSAGNSQRRSTGIAILNSTVIGIIILLSAWAVINTVLSALTPSGLTGAFWKPITCQ